MALSWGSSAPFLVFVDKLENIEKLSVNEMSVTFLFIDYNFITVMNNENFEQSSLDKTLLSGNKDFLSDGIQLTIEIIGDELRQYMTSMKSV